MNCGAPNVCEHDLYNFSARNSAKQVETHVRVHRRKLVPGPLLGDVGCKARVKRDVLWGEMFVKRVGCQLLIGRLLFIMHRDGYKQRTKRRYNA